MNAASRELLRHSLLAQLNSAAPYAVPVSTLKVYAVTMGFPKLTDQELAAELDYLNGKKLIEQHAKEISPENIRWKITAEGRDVAAKEGL